MSDHDTLLDLPPPTEPSEMLDTRPRFARPWMVALAALAVGLAIDVLGLHQPPGIGLAVALSLGLLVAASISLLMGTSSPRGLAVVLAAGLATAAMVAVRTSPVLLSLNIGMSAAVMGVMAQMHRKPVLAGWTITRYLLAPFATMDDMAVGAVRFVGADLKSSLEEQQSDRVRSVWIGVLIATPLLLVFASLFASADAVFSSRLDGLVRGIFFGHAFWRVVFVLLIATAAAGLWHSMRDPRPAEPILERRQRMDLTTAVTVLALLVALFLFFVLTQVAGHNPALERIGDYSENARRGFFQLVVVAFLVLNVLLGFDWMTRRESGERSVAFDRLAVLLVALTGLVMVSALNRMRLYVDAFGLTELRFYSTVFMFWLAFVLVWCLATVLRNKHAVFAIGLFGSAVAFVLALNAINPDAFIVNANWQRHVDGANFSDRYNSELSLDSLPTLLAIREGSAPGQWCFIERRLALERDRLAVYQDEHGWLADSWAAARSLSLLGPLELADPTDLSCRDPRLGSIVRESQ